MSVRCERRGLVTTVVLDRPHARNAGDGDTAGELADAFRAFDADRDAAVAVLWGTGGTFCAGADLKLMSNRVEPDGDAPMGPSRLATMRTVIVPAALPSILVGLRIALGVGWTAIVAAELAVGAKAGGGGSGGIGQMMFVFYAYSIELNRIIVCMIAVGIVALVLDRALRAAMRALMPWSR